eukprot:3522246-Pleurochrysis_carterae.AAC.2
MRGSGVFAAGRGDGIARGTEVRLLRTFGPCAVAPASRSAHAQPACRRALFLFGAVHLRRRRWHERRHGVGDAVVALGRGHVAQLHGDVEALVGRLGQRARHLLRHEVAVGRVAGGPDVSEHGEHVTRLLVVGRDDNIKLVCGGVCRCGLQPSTPPVGAT